MSVILFTAYAIDPYKGSENGSAWNFINEISKKRKVIAFTRENNLPEIARYQDQFPQPHYANQQWIGYDLPLHLRFWKRGGFGALPYYYLWQRTIPDHIKSLSLDFDIVHNLNFNNDWTPSYLWKLGKPFVWGPIGHHPLIPRDFILPVYGWKSYLSDRFRWMVKQLFWKTSPALRNTLKYADVILPMNRSVAEVIPLADKRIYLIPSAGSETVPTPPERNGDSFRVISVGRFVDLKGFDLTLRAFGQMYRGLTARERENTHLFLVGKGPAKSLLEKILADEKIEGSVTFIDWIDRRDLAQLYRNSDVFCFPSHEGAGMVVPEAMSHGLPVVCLDNCGPGEFITPECGIAQPYKSYDETVSGLASALTLLHRDKALRARMSVAARAHFDARFDWRQKAVQLEPIYLSLLSQTYARQH